MGSVLVFEAPRTVAVASEDERALEAHEVRLRTLLSGISAGTELTAYRGTNPYLHKRWDSHRRLFAADERGAPEYPLSGWGYEEVGEIVELGSDVADLAAGQRVYGTWGHRTSWRASRAPASSRSIRSSRGWISPAGWVRTLSSMPALAARHAAQRPSRRSSPLGEHG